MGSTTFVTHGILDGVENVLDINTWLYKEPPPKSEALLDHFIKKYPWSHRLAIEKLDYQGDGLGHQELGMRQPIEAHQG